MLLLLLLFYLLWKANAFHYSHTLLTFCMITVNLRQRLHFESTLEVWRVVQLSPHNLSPQTEPSNLQVFWEDVHRKISEIFSLPTDCRSRWRFRLCLGTRPHSCHWKWPDGGCLDVEIYHQTLAVWLVWNERWWESQIHNHNWEHMKKLFPRSVIFTTVLQPQEWQGKALHQIL